jgi:hypothetical protein
MKIETKKEIRSDVSQLAIELAKVLSFIDYEQVFHLSKRESFVLKSRLSLKSIEQIGDELDLTRERTRQILVKSIHILNRRVNYMVFLCEEAKKDREIAEKTKEEITQMRLNGFQESFKYGILPIRNFYGELSVRTIKSLKDKKIVIVLQRLVMVIRKLAKDMIEHYKSAPNVLTLLPYDMYWNY